MSFKDVEGDAEEQYWNPEEIGESVEGNLCTWLKDQYGNQIGVLDSTDEEGNDIKIILPSHKNLRRFYKRLNIGDYILVKLVDLKPIKRSKHKKRIYKVLVDDDQFVDYDEEW